MDPNFAYHKAIAQLYGLLGLRLADAVLLPLNYTEYGSDLFKFFDKLKDLIQQNNGSDVINVQPLLDAVTKFYDVAKKPVNRSNDVLTFTERAFLGPGLPSRPIYKHVIQAPGLYLGYDTDTFPGVSQAVRSQDWDLAKDQLEILTHRILIAADGLE